MKLIAKILGIVVLLGLFAGSNAYSQKVVKVKSNPHHKAVVVKNKNGKVKRVVYRPHWAPKRTYHHRWVYFPRHNFYWDNVKRVYVYRNGVKWVALATLPAAYAKVNLENEKSVELTTVDDSTETVYDKNEQHIKELKVEE